MDEVNGHALKDQTDVMRLGFKKIVLEISDNMVMKKVVTFQRQGEAAAMEYVISYFLLFLPHLNSDSFEGFGHLSAHQKTGYVHL